MLSSALQTGRYGIPPVILSIPVLLFSVILLMAFIWIESPPNISILPSVLVASFTLTCCSFSVYSRNIFMCILNCVVCVSSPFISFSRCQFFFKHLNLTLLLYFWQSFDMFTFFVVYFFFSYHLFLYFRPSFQDQFYSS